MATTLSFAYNSGSTLSNCQQIGQLAILTGNTLPPQHPNTNRFWPSPDVDTKYIIAKPDSGSTRTSTIGITPFLGFNGTSVKTNNDFSGLASSYLNLPSNTYSNAALWRAKLTENNVWTNYYSGITIVGSTSGLTSGLENFNLTIPAGSQQNDFLIVIANNSLVSVSGGTDNWRGLTGTTNSDLYYKILYSGETGSVTVNAGGQACVSLFLVRGLDTNQFTTINSKQQSTFKTTTGSSLSINTNQIGSILFYNFNIDDDGDFPNPQIQIPNELQIVSSLSATNKSQRVAILNSDYVEIIPPYTATSNVQVSYIDIGVYGFNSMISFPRTYDVLYTTGNWTKPSGITQLLIECWGAGGAGGGATTNLRTGGGGASGQYARKTLTYPSAQQSISFIIGSGGVGGTGTGPTGGDTSWDGGLVLAKGGPGGSANLDPAPGGVGLDTGGVGDVVYSGNSGGFGSYNSFTQSAQGGFGAPNSGSENARTQFGDFYRFDFGGLGGFGGLAQFSSAANGERGGNFGAGGGGGGRISVTNANGGNGSPGLIRVSYLPTQYQ